MNAKQMSEYIGQRGLLKITGTELQVPVIVLDVRETFGRMDFRVLAIDGVGTTWVQSNRVKLNSTQF